MPYGGFDHPNVEYFEPINIKCFMQTIRTINYLHPIRHPQRYATAHTHTHARTQRHTCARTHT